MPCRQELTPKPAISGSAGTMPSVQLMSLPQSSMDVMRFLQVRCDSSRFDMALSALGREINRLLDMVLVKALCGDDSRARHSRRGGNRT